MTVDLETYNDAGKKQFDTNSSAFALVGSGTIKAADVWFVPGTGYTHDYDPTSGVPGAFYDGTYSLATVTVPSNTELIAFMNTGDHWGTPNWFKRAVDGTKGVSYSTQPCAYNDPSGLVPRSDLPEHWLSYYAYTSMRNLTPPAHGVGLQLINADGTLAWDSSLRPILITGSASYTAANYPTGVSVSGSSPAAIICLDFFGAPSRKSGIDYKLGMKGNLVREYAYKNNGLSGNVALATPLAGGYRLLGVHSLSLG